MSGRDTTHARTVPKPGGWERRKSRCARSPRPTRTIRSRSHACVVAATIVLALLSTGCIPSVDVNDVCATFVHRDTPPVSPVLRRGADGTLELLVEVTEVAEAQAVLAAARKEPIDVMLYPSEKFAHVLRVDGDTLVVKANSQEHAANLIDALCIAPGDP